MLAVLAGLVLADRRGVRATVVWIWLVGVGSARSRATSPTSRSGRPGSAVMDAPSVVPVTWWSGAELMVAVAVVSALLVAAAARWRGAGRLGTLFSGFAGPSVVAAAYVIVRPALQGRPTNLLEPFQAAR